MARKQPTPIDECNVFRVTHAGAVLVGRFPSLYSASCEAIAIEAEGYDVEVSDARTGAPIRDWRGY